MSIRNLTKKILFGLATTGAIIAPVAFAISCGGGGGSSHTSNGSGGNSDTGLSSSSTSTFQPDGASSSDRGTIGVKVFDSVANQEVSVRDLFYSGFNTTYDSVASLIINPYLDVWSIMHPEEAVLLGTSSTYNSVLVDSSKFFSSDSSYQGFGKKDGKDVAQFKTFGFSNWAKEINQRGSNGYWKNTGDYLYAFATPSKELEKLDKGLYDALNHFAFKKGVIKQIVDFVNNTNSSFGDGRDDAIRRLKGKLNDANEVKLTDNDLDDEGNIYISFQDITDTMNRIGHARIDPKDFDLTIFPEKTKTIASPKDWSSYIGGSNAWRIYEWKEWNNNGQTTNSTLLYESNY